MTLQEKTIGKIRQLPDSLAQQVYDFVDFLMMDEDDETWSLWQQFYQVTSIPNLQFADLQVNLEELEKALDNLDQEALV